MHVRHDAVDLAPVRLVIARRKALQRADQAKGGRRFVTPAVASATIPRRNCRRALRRRDRQRVVAAVVAHGVEIDAAQQRHEVIIGMAHMRAALFELGHHQPRDLLRA